MRIPLVALSLAILCVVPALSAQGGDGDIKKQIADLKDKKPLTRYKAAETLGKLGPKAPAAAIDALAVAIGDEDPAVRHAAGASLLSIGEPAIEALLGAVDSSNRAAQLMALTVMIRMGPDAKSATKELAKALFDPDTDVRIHAAVALQAIGPAAKEALPDLIKASADTSSLAGGESLRPNLPSGVSHAALLAIRAIDPKSLEEAAKRSVPNLLKAFTLDVKALEQAAKLNSPTLLKTLQLEYESRRLAAIYSIGVLGPLAKEAIAQLTKTYFEEKGLLHAAAFGALYDIGPEGHQVLWALAADSKSSYQQRVMVFGVFWWQRNDVSPFTLERLRAFTKHKEPVMRRMAVDILGSLGPVAKAAIPEIVATMSDKAVLEIRDQFAAREGYDEVYAASRALARIGEASVPALIEAMENENSLVRFQAARALAILGRKAKKALPELRKGLNSQSSSVKLECACALLRAGDDPAEPLKVLERQLDFGDAKARWDALEIIGRVGPRAKSLVPKIIALFDDPDVVRMALFSLRTLGPAARDAVKPAAGLLDEKDFVVRDLALDLLFNLASDAKPVVKDVMPGLRNEDVNVRIAVANLLGQIGPDAKPALPALLAGIKQPEAKELRSLIYALGCIGPDAKDAVTDLIALLKHFNALTRADAARTLGDIGPAAKEALPALRERLQDDDRSVRTWAIYAIALITEDFEPNVKALSDLYKTKVFDSADEPSRTAAILALARMGPPAKKAVPVLMEAAKNATFPVAKQAVLALGQYGADSKESVPTLIELLRHDSPEMREAAAQSLGNLGPIASAAAPRLTEMANEDEDAVAEAAAGALRSIQAKTKG